MKSNIEIPDLVLRRMYNDYYDIAMKIPSHAIITQHSLYYTGFYDNLSTIKKYSSTLISVFVDKYYKEFSSAFNIEKTAGGYSIKSSNNYICFDENGRIVSDNLFDYIYLDGTDLLIDINCRNTNLSELDRFTVVNNKINFNCQYIGFYYTKINGKMKLTGYRKFGSFEIYTYDKNGKLLYINTYLQTRTPNIYNKVIYDK